MKSLSLKLIIVIGVIALLILYFLLSTQENNNRTVSRMALHTEVVTSANEVTSFAKRAEGHLFLYLMLHNEIDRTKFYQRMESLRSNIERLQDYGLNGDAVELVNQSLVMSHIMETLGTQLHRSIDLSLHDNEPVNLDILSAKITKFHSLSSSIRENGVELLKLAATELQKDQLKFEQAESNHRLLIILGMPVSLGFLIIIVYQAGRLASSQKLAKAMEDLSYLDPLTNIGNRRRFDETFSHEIQRAIRQQTTVGLMLIDVDYFKKYNDCYGHSAGDQCLKKIAGIIQDCLQRSSDIVARYGGEEFAVLLPDTDNPRLMADKIRLAVEAAHIEHKNSTASPVVTISIGVVMFTPHSGLSQEHLLRITDKALYKAKSGGRNKVEFVQLDGAEH